jgi:uncharacterized membrane protein YbhN (UPF0104 family)
MGDSHPRLSGRPSGEPSGGGTWRQYVKSGLLLLVGGVSLYLLLPTLVSVFSSWRSLLHLEWGFAVLVFACEGASYVCLWQLDRIGLATRAWFPIATAQLSGTAVGRFVPGPPTPFTVELLHKAGVDTGKAAAALTTSTGLQLATTAALPLLALPAIIFGARRSTAAWPTRPTSAVPCWCCSWRPGRWSLRPTGHLSSPAAPSSGCSTPRSAGPVVDLSQQLLANRDFIRTTLGGRWKPAVVAAVANIGFDYLALLCALRAVGAAPRPSLVVLAYSSAGLLALVPFTPGGLGLSRRGWSAR